MKTKATFIGLGLIIMSACAEKMTFLDTETKTSAGSLGIIPLKDTLVKPVLYSKIPDFNNLPVNEAKEKFIAAVLPAILVAKYQIEQDRTQIMKLAHKEVWSPSDSTFFNEQSTRYNGNTVAKLLAKMRTHPNSIVLAQAIVESGWGSSRFFRKANNLFGIWSYRSNEPRIEASLSRGETEVYLRKYDDISESVIDYFQTVGRSRAYRHFRKTRATTSDVSKLLPHLKYYSERRDEYVTQLQTIIRQNSLTQYDNYRINPAYFIEKEIESLDSKNAIVASIFGDS